MVLYLTVTIPNIKTVLEPLAEDSIQDQREALSVLAAGNTLIVACLVAVLTLQASLLPPFAFPSLSNDRDGKRH